MSNVRAIPAGEGSEFGLRTICSISIINLATMTSGKLLVILSPVFTGPSIGWSEIGQRNDDVASTSL